MEKLIRIMTNGRLVDEQPTFMEEMMEMTEFAGVALACMVVLVAMSII